MGLTAPLASKSSVGTEGHFTMGHLFGSVPLTPSSSKRVVFIRVLLGNLFVYATGLRQKRRSHVHR